MDFFKILEDSRVIAILRGISPTEVIKVSKILVESGFKIIEVPLNSPKVFESIKLLSDYYKGENIFIGAGTVCKTKEVEKLKELKSSLIISPNSDSKVIEKTKELKMLSIPGFLTPSEAYDAINAGANCLKLFPFVNFDLSYYNNIKTILPKHIPIIAVGGIDETCRSYR